MTAAAGRLYEQTLAADERIPWAWIEKAVGRRAAGKRGNWDGPLILAAPEGRADDPAALAGYAYGTLLHGFGGYLSYLGVAPWARRLGVGTRLYDEFFRVMAADAARANEPLPVVVWESHRPGPDAPPAEWEVWTARTRLFDRVGGLWIDGVDFLAPNYGEADGDPVALQVFVKPVELPAAALDEARLRRLVGELHRRVYGGEPGDPLYDATLPPDCRPRLRPARLAGVKRPDLV